MRFSLNILFLIFSAFYILHSTFVYAHSETTIIKMTADGFDPQTITLDQNSTVIFLNEDSKDRWPASNNHPVHDIYTDFDPKKPIPPGASWPFKPKKSGEWKFHDHLNPHLRGTLIVKPEPGLAIKEPESSNLLEKIKLFFQAFFNQFNPKEDPAETWKNLKAKYKGQGGAIGDIHDQAHLIGGQVFEKYGLEGLSKCSSEFAFGCFHGFLDKAFEKSLDDLKKAEEACQALGEGGPASSCIHGIGHGVASFHSTTDLKASLLSCKKLSSTGQQFCFDGVFMEFERGASNSLYSKDNPFKPCDELEEEFGFACGRNQPTVLMSRFKFSFEDVIGVCLSSPSDSFKMACFDALGFISTKGTFDPVAIVSACKKIGVNEYVMRCVKAAAGEFIFQEVPGWQKNAPAICNLLESGKEECQSYIQELIRQYGKEVVSKLNVKGQDEDENEYIRNQLRVCFEANGREGCYKEVAALFFDQFGLKRTLSLFKVNENYQEVYARCHEVTHYLSRAEYEKLGSISKVYAQCDSTCHGGCYHGTLEAYLKSKNLVGVKLKEEFNKICGREEDHPSPLVFNECFHGLGHAAMFIKDMELKESLELCDTISSQQYRERCFTGVFMENSSSSTSFDHQSKYLKDNDPNYPCNSLDEKYQSLCWQYQSSYFAIISDQDWNKVANLCLQIPGEYHDRCFRTIGTNQVGFTQDMQKMKADCDLMPSEHFRDVCVGGVVSSLSYRFVGDMEKMTEFCSLVNQNNKETCFKQMGSGMLDWDGSKDLVQNRCKKIQDPEGSSWCINAL